ncbi:MAG: SsrA-binding protein SmpB [Spirochaetota bacterium]
MPSGCITTNRTEKTEKPMDIARNKRARFEYDILENFEAGIVLKGTEVKSLREGRVNINEAFAKIQNEEVFIQQMSISPYSRGNIHNHVPDRPRKLLMHKREIKRLTGKIKEKGLTLVPLRLYFKNGIAKIELGLAKGKTLYDKRETLKKRTDQREIQRTIKEYNR